MDTERWTDVPVVIQTGKALDEKLTEITIEFGWSNPGVWLANVRLCLRLVESLSKADYLASLQSQNR